MLLESWWEWAQKSTIVVTPPYGRSLSRLLMQHPSPPLQSMFLKLLGAMRLWSGATSLARLWHRFSILISVGGNFFHAVIANFLGRPGPGKFTSAVVVHAVATALGVTFPGYALVRTLAITFLHHVICTSLLCAIPNGNNGKTETLEQV